MNITDYLYAVRRRLWVPIAIPLAAALLTGIFIYLQPEKYQATATVVVPALSAKGYSTSAVTQYVSTYKDILTSTPVVNQVNNQTGEPKANLVAGLTAGTATASSNVIIVTYTGPNKGNVETVAAAAATDSLDTLMGPQLSAAESASRNSQAALDKANADIVAFTTKNHTLFPDVDYKIASQEYSQLLLQLSQAQGANDKARVRWLQPEVAKRLQALTDLAVVVDAFQTLDQARRSAESVNNKAQVDLAAVNANVASNHDPRSVIVKSIGHVSRIPEVLRYGGVAFGVALILSLAFIVFMEFLRPAVPALALGAAAGGGLASTAMMARGRGRRVSKAPVPVGAPVGPGGAGEPAAPVKPSNGEL
ncbi:MAG: Wzz/FepE/Etk N-terminal domain-containing protein [Candidatus Dormibacteraeota bacterium]|nr:Wzz/FepE/Etk N-terminal domain-containing protein [Candidatus Dormibacteraeota bacterium]